MPLSVPLLLVQGEPDRHYTVHLHRVRWSVGSVSRQLTTDHLTELEDNARRCLRMVSECNAAELEDADVEVSKNPDGSAEAVARVLCTEDECAAVGELRALLEQLPDEMPLSLDGHHRALPGEPDQVHTIHPRLVATVSGLATEAETTQPGLMLTQVYVPSTADDDEQAAAATRDDLPAYGELPRAAYHLERGELRPGLKDVAEVLEELAHLVGEVAADFTEHDEDGSQLRYLPHALVSAR